MDPAFDLAEMQGTTHATAPLIIVNGPAAQCVVSPRIGALGPAIANASIGRVIRLAMINIGGARPGTSWPCSVTAGSSASAWVGTKRTARSHRSTRVGASPPRTRPSRSSALSLRSRWRTLPEATSTIERTSHRTPGGIGRRCRFEQRLAGRRAGRDRADARPHRGTGRGRPRSIIDDRPAIGERATTRRSACVRVGRRYARGRRWIGLYSYVFPTWCAGANRNRAVTRPIDIGQACHSRALMRRCPASPV